MVAGSLVYPKAGKLIFTDIHTVSVLRRKYEYDKCGHHHLLPIIRIVLGLFIAVEKDQRTRVNHRRMIVNISAMTFV